MRQYASFHERQRLGTWVFALLGAIALGGISIAIVQIGTGRPVGNQPMSNTGLIVVDGLVSVLVPTLLMLLRLEVQTEFEGVRVLYRPFVNRLIRFEDIASAQAVTYNPLLEYGGWGIRGFGKKIAYNAQGNRGVLVTLKSGGTVLLGSQQPEDLEAAIRSGLR